MSGSAGAGGPARRKFEPLPEWAGPATRLQHAARMPDWNAGAVVPPIYQTSTYHFPSEFSEARERGEVHLYTRMTNPTVDVAAELTRDLEGGESALLFASGMGALSTTLLTLLRPGDGVVALESLYGGTTTLLGTLIAPWGIRVDSVGDLAAEAPEEQVPEGTRVVILESPTNPCLHVHDIARWAVAAHQHGAVLLVDNTFATPINQNPLAHGADLVVHSATKYLGGHSDLVAGAVVGKRDLVQRIEATHSVVGASLDPFAAFLLARGMRTLALRVAHQNASARALAEALRGHPRLHSVHYPGSASEAEEQIARRQMRGRGGVLSFAVRGGTDAARRVLRRLRLVHVAASLGGVESLASLPLETSHRHATPEQLARCGIDPGLIRLSVGVEGPDDLKRDVFEALDAS
ncbi:MAG: aminotransferase class I/II-fold pyridoxal phosphate-dependent enzyme [Thermoplasmata archaeon]|nr:aminotransferase class I/II-fold pyridoxal phosphate-dependent enzyme [Thermoplasmata archaeon]